MEFTTLLTAVKPRERSDQYRILAALFHLDAHAKAVSVTSVKQLLKLHCGKFMPTNVHASLKAYTGYVEPVPSATATLWILTSKGLDRLRSLSGLALAAIGGVAARYAVQQAI